MAVSTPTLMAILGLYVIFCGMVMYFCVLADPNSSDVAYLVQVAMPNKIWNLLSKVMGAKKMDTLQSILELALVFVYFFVVLGCWTVVFWYIYPWIDRSSYVPNYHKYIGYVVFVACFGSWRLTNKSRPGIITGISFKRYDHYPYDHLMFLKNKRCETTNLIRIPRSKFDRLKYNQNVPRYDHFCGWVHNTIGEENYRWFLLFLSIHVLMCVYGSYACAMLFLGEVIENELLGVTFFDRASGEHVPSNWFIVGQYLFSRNTLEFSVLVVMFVMAIALGGFLGYHIYITSYNRTTNEDAKWDDIKKWYKKEQKQYKDAVKKGLVKPKVSNSSSGKPQVKDGDVTCTGGGAGIEEPEEEPQYIDPGPIPKNVYDRGFVENWKEVLFPISLREDAYKMGGYSRPNNTTTQTQNTRTQPEPPSSTANKMD